MFESTAFIPLKLSLASGQCSTQCTAMSTETFMVNMGQIMGKMGKNDKTIIVMEVYSPFKYT